MELRSSALPNPSKKVPLVPKTFPRAFAEPARESGKPPRTPVPTRARARARARTRFPLLFLAHLIARPPAPQIPSPVTLPRRRSPSLVPRAHSPPSSPSCRPAVLVRSSASPPWTQVQDEDLRRICSSPTRAGRGLGPPPAPPYKPPPRRWRTVIDCRFPAATGRVRPDLHRHRLSGLVYTGSNKIRQTVSLSPPPLCPGAASLP